jgi:hypothetical protein
MTASKTKRPLRITFLSLLAVLVAAWNVLRLLAAYHFADTLIKYHAHPIYLAVTGFLGLAGASAVAWGLWRGTYWGWWAALAASIVFPVFYWGDRVFLQTVRANWPFVLGAMFLILPLIEILLFSTRTRNYTRKIL